MLHRFIAMLLLGALVVPTSACSAGAHNGFLPATQSAASRTTQDDQPPHP